MKTIRVVAAVICDSMQAKRKIYATARGYGDYKGQWEFPGGKIEPGETPQQALKREIDDIDSVPWLPADQTILDVIRSSMQPVEPLHTSEYDNEPLQRG